MKRKNIVLILSILLVSQVLTFAHGNSTYNISKHLMYREKIYTEYGEIAQIFSDLKQVQALNVWTASMMKSVSDKNYLLSSYNQLKNYIWNKQIIDLSLHYYYIDDFENFAKTIEFYFFNMSIFLWEVGSSPHFQNASIYKKEALRSSTHGLKSLVSLKSCLMRNRYIGSAYKKKEKIITLAKVCLENSQFNRMRKNVRNLLALNVNPKYNGPESVKSFAGHIPGNSVALFNANFFDSDFISYLGVLDDRLLNTVNKFSNKRYVDMTVEDFKSAMDVSKDALMNFFTKKEGFPGLINVDGPNAHKGFLPFKGGYPNIFNEMYKAIDEAKESVYLNIFFFGGTMGNVIAKLLIDKVQKNKEFKVFIMTDMENPMAFKKELDITYNYLRAYSEKFPQDHLIIVPASLALSRRSVMPPFADLLGQNSDLEHLVGKQFIKQFQEVMNFHPGGKSDHSKVLLIDAKNPKNGIAFVGSKNITDSAGPLVYDEVVKIQGPAVGVIMDSYYYDLFEALKLEYGKNKQFIKNHCLSLTNWACSTASSTLYGILKPLDILGRTQRNSGVFKWEIKGDVTLQVGQNNVYGTIRSPLEQDIDAILSANKQIIISDQFLFSPQIVSAIRYALIKNPYLKVFIMLYDMENPIATNKYFGKFPNNLFIPDLTSDNELNKRIKVKWKSIPLKNKHALKRVAHDFRINFLPKYHLKSISVDGVLQNEYDFWKCDQALKGKVIKIKKHKSIPFLISGSANKDIMSLSGGFREFQVMLFDEKSSTQHDCLFWNYWNNPEASRKADPYDFILPDSLVKKLGGKSHNKLTAKKKFMEILKTFMLTSWNFEEFFY